MPGPKLSINKAMNKSTFIITTLAAAGTGFVAGLLFAPDKGSSTRNNISKKSHEYSDYVTDRFGNLVNTVAHPFEDADDKVLRMAKNTESKAKKMVEKAENRIKKYT
jgi:gas vesicle protein